MICLMARKTYSDEFRRQAVDLFESTPGATLKGIAADLGITRGALAQWVRVLGTGTTTPASPSAAAGSAGPASRASSGPRAAGVAGAAGQARAESPAARIARLEAKVAELEAEKTKLSTEREILRQAAKYFAGETNW